MIGRGAEAFADCSPTVQPEFIFGQVRIRRAGQCGRWN